MGTSPAARRRRLLLAVLAVAVLAAAVVVVVLHPWRGTAPPRAATRTPAAGTASARGTYLALGDSVPFGFRADAVADYPRPATFSGYPELVGRDRGLDVLNASCPGETTASFTDTTAGSFGCENSPRTPAMGYRTVYPLHAAYALPESQLDYAVGVLTDRHDIRLVTVQLGANDAFLCRQTTADGCASEAVAMAARAGQNLQAILTALRAHYGGRIVVVTYYALDYSGTAAATTQALDDVLSRAASASGAVVASGFEAFRPAAQQAGGNSVAAGLVIPGDVHPTAKGQRLLATAVEDALGR